MNFEEMLVVLIVSTFTGAIGKLFLFYVYIFSRCNKWLQDESFCLLETVKYVSDMHSVVQPVVVCQIHASSLHFTSPTYKDITIMQPLTSIGRIDRCRGK